MGPVYFLRTVVRGGNPGHSTLRDGVVSGT